MKEKTKIGLRRSANAEVSSEFYQERRKEIITTAASVFQELGYEATTIADIAERLGADRASIYYYFDSKKALFQQVVRESAQRNVGVIEQLADSNRTASEKLRDAYVSLMESYSSTYPYLHVFLQERSPTMVPPGDPWVAETRDWTERYYKAMRKIIQQGVDEGEFELPLPVGLAAMAVIGTINWAHRWYKPGGELPPDVIGDGFAMIALNGLRGKTAKKMKSGAYRS